MSLRLSLPFSDPETRSEGGLNFVYNYSSRATFLACSNRALFRCAKERKKEKVPRAELAGRGGCGWRRRRPRRQWRRWGSGSGGVGGGGGSVGSGGGGRSPRAGGRSRWRPPRAGGRRALAAAERCGGRRALWRPPSARGPPRWRPPMPLRGDSEEIGFLPFALEVLPLALEHARDVQRPEQCPLGSDTRSIHTSLPLVHSRRREGFCAAAV